MEAIKVRKYDWIDQFLAATNKVSLRCCVYKMQKNKNI